MCSSETLYVPKLTTSHIPKLTQNVPNLTDYPNVPKIEQSLIFGSVALTSDKVIF